jgi:2,3-dihydroxyphenylpropionate 1,2-dioxygenase
MVAAWTDGRDNWQQYDARRREIIRAAEAAISPAFDDRFLDLLERGRTADLLTHTSASLEEAAGNGAQEIRTWLVMAAALGHAPGRRLAYEEMPEWLTGMAVAVLDPAAIR